MKALALRLAGRALDRFEQTDPETIEDLTLGAGAVLALLVLLALGGCGASYKDPGPLAFGSGDVSALLVGCGEPLPRGSLYCPFPVGWRPTGAVFVFVPPVDCGAESCATVTVMQPDASMALTKVVEKGQTAVMIPWAQLLGPGPLQPDRRGFWPIVVKWSWLDEAGVVQQSAAEGEVRLRVHRADYTPLVFDPAAQTWTWRAGGKVFGMTDAGRGAVKP